VHALPRNDGQARDRAQVGRDRLGNPGPQPVILGIPRDVGEPRDGSGGNRGLREHGARSTLAQRLEVLSHPGHVRVALVPLLGHHLARDAFELAAQAGLELGRGAGILPEDRVQDLHGVVASERRTPGKQLIEHDAEREHIAASVERLAPSLLGRHVGHGSDHGSGLLQLHDPAPRVVTAVGRWRVLRQAEIEELHTPSVADHHVGGLDVSVDDALGVGLSQGLGQLRDDVQGFAGREGALHQDLLEALSRDVLHRDEAAPRALELGLADLVDHRDAWMVEGRRDPRLPDHAIVCLVALGAMRQHLERYRPAQARVLGQEHLTHAPRAQVVEDPIV